MRPLSKKAKIVVLAAAAACAATTVTAAVASTPGPARAPFSQASALVEFNGTTSQAKGIKSVTKPQAGIYCIKFTDNRLDPQKLIPTATIAAMGSYVGEPGATPNGSTLMIRTDPFKECGDDPEAITVITSNADNNYADTGFYFTVA